MYETYTEAGNIKINLKQLFETKPFLEVELHLLMLAQNR